MRDKMRLLLLANGKPLKGPRLRFVWMEYSVVSSAGCSVESMETLLYRHGSSGRLTLGLFARTLVYTLCIRSSWYSRLQPTALARAAAVPPSPERQQLRQHQQAPARVLGPLNGCSCHLWLSSDQSFKWLTSWVLILGVGLLLGTYF